jgi:predicted Rossmann fold nucleotide-binding protein DprA/Smf involved in DNA uptake
MLPQQPYLVRNETIVKQSQVLLAAPRTSKDEQRSGTWHTIRYARKMKRKIYIVMPDGVIRKEG